jgi:hypothetical protein
MFADLVAEFQCPVLGVKRTLTGRAPMSAFDPKRTFSPLPMGGFDPLRWLVLSLGEGNETAL